MNLDEDLKRTTIDDMGVEDLLKFNGLSHNGVLDPLRQPDGNNLLLLSPFVLWHGWSERRAERRW